MITQMTESLHKALVKRTSYSRSVNAVCNILCFVAINAWVLCESVTRKSNSRHQFFKDLVDDVREQFLLSLSISKEKKLIVWSNRNT